MCLALTLGEEYLTANDVPKIGRGTPFQRRHDVRQPPKHADRLALDAATLTASCAPAYVGPRVIPHHNVTLHCRCRHGMRPPKACGLALCVALPLVVQVPSSIGAQEAAGHNTQSDTRVACNGNEQPRH